MAEHPPTPPLLARAIDLGALRLEWRDATRVRAAVLQPHAEVEPFHALGDALLSWPATEGIASLELGLAGLFWARPPLQARLSSLCALRAWSTYETVSLDWISEHAGALEQLVLTEMSAEAGALRLDRLIELSLWDLLAPLETHRASYCPRVRTLSVPLLDTLGRTEAEAMVAAFPAVVALETAVADLDHALAVAPAMRQLEGLARWTLRYLRGEPSPDDDARIAAALGRDGVASVAG